ncbi:flavin reductase family protein [uncultured Corynebacterium sp.]|uniref:flavin reductase family protein n=1 Tax=uncultured Corynebacterium sp. TaxID=159447 RepID=UPI0025CC03F2|nr:flavin reductase family protein [uncultured Corynebacterium sp.]
MTHADPHPAALETMDEMSIRRALSEFVTGVTIVATDDGQPAGFACQSFSSLSLDPPLVLFTVMKTSQTWPRIEATGRFAVSVLTEDQVEVSMAFGRRRADKFDHGEWARSPLGNPVLHDCATWIDCSVADVHDGGDHHIVVGRIETIGHRSDGRPLIYHRGSYANVVAAGHDAPAGESWRQRPSV